MRLTPSAIWSCTFAATGAGWLVFPAARPGASIVLALHAAVLLAGVADQRLQFFCPVRRRRPDQRTRVCLTFDDGTDPALTADILRLLAAHGARATFFVVGERARRHPELVARAFGEGHTIGSHGLTHGVFSNFRLTRAQTRDIDASCRIVEEIIGRIPRLYRPPVGLTNPHTPRAMRRLGMECIGWSRTAREAGNRLLSSIKRIDRLAGPGEVVLLHDALPRPAYKREILARIDGLLCAIEGAGLQTVTVGELFGIEEYVKRQDTRAPARTA